MHPNVMGSYQLCGKVLTGIHVVFKETQNQIVRCVLETQGWLSNKMELFLVDFRHLTWILT